MNPDGKMQLVSMPGKELHGVSSLPGDKSLAHRAALLAALGRGGSSIENFLVAGVTQVMLEALTCLGVSWELQGTHLVVHGSGFEGLQTPGEPIDCGSSATTMRLLAGALAAAGIPAVLDGSSGLRRRPMGRIVAPLQAMGVSIEATDGRPPLELDAARRPLRALHYRLPVASAQVKSCLLLAALAASGRTLLDEPGPSRDHTERMLVSLGVRVASTQAMEDGKLWYRTEIEPPAALELQARTLSLPGDISSAGFLIVGGLIVPGSEITLKDVLLNPTRTGLIDALREMGGDIEVHGAGERHGEPVGDLTVRYSLLTGVQVSGERVVRMIDEFPAFAVAAAYAHGRTTVCQAEELRHKESDRISALTGELRSLGADAAETQDGFIISGGRGLRGGQAHSHGDHRLAMALAVAGLAAREPVIVHEAEAIHESFPDFVSTLRSLGALLLAEGEA